MSSETDRAVILRPWFDEDLPLLQRLMGDPEVMAHLGGPESPEKIRERHERYWHGIRPGTGCMFAILIAEEQIPAGSVGYWECKWNDQIIWETGWMVLPEFQGKGIATRATAAAIERVRAEMRHRSLHAFPSVDNAASNAICQKLGFTFRGETEVDYPPGNFMRCNDCRLDLYPDVPPDSLP